VVDGSGSNINQKEQISLVNLEKDDKKIEIENSQDVDLKDLNKILSKNK